MANDDQTIDERYMVPGLSRGLALLQMFKSSTARLNLTEIAEGLGLSRSATYRLVYTLEVEGYLHRDPVTRRYRLTSKVFSLGFEYLEGQPLVDAAQPYLRDLSQRTQTAAHLVVLDGCYSVYLARSAPPVILIANLQIGTRLPCHLTSSGRIQLAYMDEERLSSIWQMILREFPNHDRPSSFGEFCLQAERDRQNGYVFRRSYFNSATISVACALRDRSGNAVAAINIVGATEHMEKLGGEAVLVPLVSNAVSTLSSSVGFSNSGLIRSQS